eukprot:TRINITY_DN18303_c0_g1_i1.p1 TRINITY_DN18303_c0_g1~~TRINITY_DN18303_c0_g1_i1.p1  ORF type:complete len:202 (+),score=11.90 TRINITY_DN18303_c0_g1_i1:77-682(+)
MKGLCLLVFLGYICAAVESVSISEETVGAYSGAVAKEYVEKYWQTPNHDCKKEYISCSPWSCWGDYCGYPSHGGDCANFVSQSLIAGGHPYLNQGFPCRGYPCGKEEIGARNLGNCLANVHHWNRTCGYQQPPPSWLVIGDVLIYHTNGCEDIDAHATIITKLPDANTVLVSCHSPSLFDQHYKHVTERQYYSWLHYETPQ